jgi:hypothetical protein
MFFPGTAPSRDYCPSKVLALTLQLLENYAVCGVDGLHSLYAERTFTQKSTCGCCAIGHGGAVAYLCLHHNRVCPLSQVGLDEVEVMCGCGIQQKADLFRSQLALCEHIGYPVPVGVRAVGVVSAQGSGKLLRSFIKNDDSRCSLNTVDKDLDVNACVCGGDVRNSFTAFHRGVGEEAGFERNADKKVIWRLLCVSVLSGRFPSHRHHLL